MYCGSCLRDNALAAELVARGQDVTLLPLYTPLLSDEPNVSRSTVLFGGISVYLQQHAPLFRKMPRLVDRLLDSPWLIGAFTLMAILYWGFGLTVAIQSRERLTSTQKGLVGLVGEARGELKPEGPVFVKGTLWRGRSAGEPIASGTRVRVRAVDGLILRVEPEPAATSAGETASPADPRD